jgi:hypothetical protein
VKESFQTNDVEFCGDYYIFSCLEDSGMDVRSSAINERPSNERIFCFGVTKDFSFDHTTDWNGCARRGYAFDFHEGSLGMEMPPPSGEDSRGSLGYDLPLRSSEHERHE